MPICLGGIVAKFLGESFAVPKGQTGILADDVRGSMRDLEMHAVGAILGNK